VSRSVHARPRAIRAAERLRAPNAPRGANDLSKPYRFGRIFKERGIATEPGRSQSGDARHDILPHVHFQRPAPGLHHPVARADIVRVLAFFGAECVYGVRSIALVNPPRTIQTLLGRLIVPGRIMLYAQPRSPWALPGRLSDAIADHFLSAGAIIDVRGDGAQTMIAWPGETLRDFMLFDVLMHEIGHHLIQQYKGKRRDRVMRTKDHEAFAAHFARQCRARYLAERAD
jgi:hypothetical protein